MVTLLSGLSASYAVQMRSKERPPSRLRATPMFHPVMKTVLFSGDPISPKEGEKAMLWTITVPPGLNCS